MNIFFGIIFIIMGCISVIFPRQMIYFQHMFTFKKGAEPTDFAIIMTIISGVCLIIFGIALFFIPIPPAPKYRY